MRVHTANPALVSVWQKCLSSAINRWNEGGEPPDPLIPCRQSLNQLSACAGLANSVRQRALVPTWSSDMRTCKAFLVQYLSGLIVLIATATTGLAAETGAAGGCGAASGKVIFEDKFNDSTGGWDKDPSAKFDQRGLTLTLGAKESVWRYTNNSFDARDGEYCLEAVLPDAVSADNTAAIGLILLYVNEDNYVTLQVFGDNTAQLLRISKGKVNTLVDEKNEALGAAFGKAVRERLILKQGLLTAFVNDVQVAKTRVEVADGATKFGIMVTTDKPPGKPLDFAIKSFRLSAAP